VIRITGTAGLLKTVEVAEFIELFRSLGRR
jgi:hypothetical protein